MWVISWNVLVPCGYQKGTHQVLISLQCQMLWIEHQRDLLLVLHLKYLHLSVLSNWSLKPLEHQVFSHNDISTVLHKEQRDKACFMWSCDWIEIIIIIKSEIILRSSKNTFQMKKECITLWAVLIFQQPEASEDSPIKDLSQRETQSQTFISTANKTTAWSLQAAGSPNPWNDL